MSFFQELPRELQLQVAGFCSLPTLASFSATSKALNSLITPILYRVVDLSSHNGPDIKTAMHFSKVPSDWPEHRCNPLDGIVYDKQRALIRTLRSHPSLGEYVRVLRWTTVDYPNYVEYEEVLPLYSQWDERIISQRELDVSLEEYTFNDCTSRLWDTFSTFTHVLDVDIAFMASREREACPPPPLFQHVQSLRLSGMASSFLIRSILKSIHPTSLRHLHLGNLNQYAELEGVPEDLTIREKGKMVPPFDRRYARNAGLMRAHLPECSSKWSNLQSLIIDTAGLSGPRLDTISVMDAEILEAEDMRYQGLGTLIRSMAKTIYAFRFQQGPINREYEDGWRIPRHVADGRPVPPQDGLRPMDDFFHRHILSAILESSWPRLEKMELFGVASHTCYPNREAPSTNSPLSNETLSQIRAAVGPGPTLDIRPEATRLFWITDL